jgi:histidine triad (HIT) family protein
VNDTIFDNILDGRIPVEAVYEDDDVLAFRDINPKAPVHVLVIPKVRSERFAELAERPFEETGRFFAAVSKVAEILGLNDKGYRIVINNGPDAGQEVEYLHAHILGGRTLKWPPG